MEKVYLISVCRSIGRKYYIFPLKGYYDGVRISEVHIEKNHLLNNSFVGSECLLKIYAKGRYQHILFGIAIEVKRLNKST
jgi:hypothetical protein